MDKNRDKTFQDKNLPFIYLCSLHSSFQILICVTTFHHPVMSLYPLIQSSATPYVKVLGYYCVRKVFPFQYAVVITLSNSFKRLAEYSSHKLFWLLHVVSFPLKEYLINSHLDELRNPFCSNARKYTKIVHINVLSRLLDAKLGGPVIILMMDFLNSSTIFTSQSDI